MKLHKPRREELLQERLENMMFNEKWTPKVNVSYIFCMLKKYTYLSLNRCIAA